MAESVSYIIAAYNEESLIEDAVIECHTVLKNDFDDFEIILVDDGSQDRTGLIMDMLSERLDNVYVLHNLINLNFGVSILRGLKFARKDIIIFNASDLPLSPKLTKGIISEMADCDLLVLERECYVGAMWRRLTSSINLLLLRLLYPNLMKGTPIVNFVQVFRREIIDSILPLARSPIFVWPELVFRGKLKDGVRVGNLRVPLNVRSPIDEAPRKGAFGKPNDIIWGIYDMLRFRLRLWNKKYKDSLIQR